MSVETLTAMPSSIEQGGDYVVSLAYGDYPTSAWSARLVFARPGSGDQPINFDATEANSRYVFTLTNLITGTMQPGIWQYSVFVRDSDSNRVTAETGSFGVLDNLEVAQTPTPAQAMLAELETAILTLTSSTNQSVSFNGQSYTRASLPSLRGERTKLQAEVWREQQAQRRLRGTEPSGFLAINFG